MKKSLFLLFLGVVFMSSQIIAQMSVSGTVSDADGEPLIGVNIVEKGTTNGTVTDLDGNYSIRVAEGAFLVFSYVGYDDQEMAAAASLSVVMQEAGILDEIVVSALSIERNSREVVYANQTIGGDDLVKVPQKTALEALRGKLAGVKINTGSGSVGASTKIVARAESSITGDNNVLIVIDGVPIDNSASRGGDGGSSAGYVDYGNRFNDLNPDDIESLTMLKGPSATALYGSRGASGVLVVTTKKGGSGDDGKMEIGVNHSTTFEKAYVLLQRQDQYGQGFGIPFAATPSFDSGENWSWGPAFDGVVRPWTSPVDSDGDGDFEFLSRPYNAVENQLEKFFQTGQTVNNSIYFSGSKNKFNYRFSYANVFQKGILENTSYKRNSFTFTAGAVLSDKLKTDFSVSYANINQQSAQEGSRPFEGNNAYANAVQSPVNIPLHELADYNSPFHDLNGYYGSYTVNPYLILNENENKAGINNLFGRFSLTYTPIEGLDLIARAGTNYVTRNITEVQSKYAYADHFIWENDLAVGVRGGRHESNGLYSELNGSATNIDISALANYHKSFGSTGDYSINVAAGYNFFQRGGEYVSGETVGGLVVADFYSLSNSVQAPLANQDRFKRRLYGVYGTASFGWRNMLFAEYSARNDWSSTLPQENNSFFYQAGGLSAIITEIGALKNKKHFNYLKVRANVGTTGKDAQVYRTNSTYIGNPVLQGLANGHDLTFPLNGQAAFTTSDIIGNNELKPELTLSFEAGADVALFQNRLNVEYTWYKSIHSEQIVNVDLPASTGYRSTTINLGEMQNTGHELSVNVKPVKGVKDFSWDLNYIFSKNKNEVTKVSSDVITSDEVAIGSIGGVSTIAKEGYPFGTFKGQVVQLNDAGQVVVGANGLPLLDPEEQLLGNYQPKFTTSFGTDIGYKGLSFNILFDVKVGGQFLSLTKDLTEFNGTSVTTLIGDRSAFVVENSVVQTGVDGEGNPTYAENTVEVAPYNYIRQLPFSSHLIDAGFVKLREIGLNYDLPSKLFKNNAISSIRIGISAKNVKFWLPEGNTFADPEVSGPGGLADESAGRSGNNSGIETTQTPPARSFGFNVGIKF